MGLAELTKTLSPTTAPSSQRPSPGGSPRTTPCARSCVTSFPPRRLIERSASQARLWRRRQLLPADPRGGGDRRQRAGGGGAAAAVRASTRSPSPSAPPAPACPARRSAIPFWRSWARAGTASGIEDNAGKVRLQAGVIGSDANRFLARFGRKIGPDPASINACKIGGIAANNASGMCCGTAQNSYHTLAAHAGDAGRRHAARHRRCREPRRLRPQPRRSARAAAPAGRADPRRRRAGRADPPQVRDQEHHRLQPERAGRLHRPVRHPRAPDDRLRRHARLHLRGHLPHRRRARRQGERADAVSQRGRGLRGGDPAEAHAGRRRRADGPGQPALGRGQAGHARLHPRPAGRRHRAAGRDPRRRPGAADGQHRRDHRRPSPTCRRCGRSSSPTCRPSSSGCGTSARGCSRRSAPCARPARR